MIQYGSPAPTVTRQEYLYHCSGKSGCEAPHGRDRREWPLTVFRAVGDLAPQPYNPEKSPSRRPREINGRIKGSYRSPKRERGTGLHTRGLGGLGGGCRASCRIRGMLGESLSWSRGVSFLVFLVRGRCRGECLASVAGNAGMGLCYACQILGCFSWAFARVWKISVIGMSFEKRKEVLR